MHFLDMQALETPAERAGVRRLLQLHDMLQGEVAHLLDLRAARGASEPADQLDDTLLVSCAASLHKNCTACCGYQPSTSARQPADAAVGILNENATPSCTVAQGGMEARFKIDMFTASVSASGFLFVTALQRCVRKVAHIAFADGAKGEEALRKLLDMKDNNIFKGLRALCAPGGPFSVLCSCLRPAMSAVMTEGSDPRRDTNFAEIGLLKPQGLIVVPLNCGQAQRGRSASGSRRRWCSGWAAVAPRALPSPRCAAASRPACWRPSTFRSCSRSPLRCLVLAA